MNRIKEIFMGSQKLSSEAALVKDTFEFVNLVRKDTRENFMLGAQSMGYFLEDTGSASDMARQLVKLVAEDSGPFFDNLKKEERPLDYADVGSIIQITKPGLLLGKAAVVESIGYAGVMAQVEGVSVELDFKDFTVTLKRRPGKTEIKM